MTTYIVTRWCCNSGNCDTCWDLGHGNRVRVEQLRTTDKTSVERCLHNWENFEGGGWEPRLAVLDEPEEEYCPGYDNHSPGVGVPIISLPAETPSQRVRRETVEHEAVELSPEGD